MGKPATIESLQSLRGIFAVLIFFSHIRTLSGGYMLPAGGDSGVAFFFILSGYVLCQAHERKMAEPPHSGKLSDAGEYGRFMLKRVVRVYPLHLLCWGWCVIISLINFGSGALLPDAANLLLLQSWVPLREYFFSANAPSWCLSDFMFFYLLFPLLLTWVVKRGKSFIFAVAILSAIWGAVALQIPEKYQAWAVYICPVTRLLDFAAGMALWQITRGLRQSGALRRLSARKANLWQCAALLLWAVSFFMYNRAETPLIMSLYWWPAVLLSIAVFSCTDRKGVIGRLLNMRPLVSFGNVSFSFYLIHLIAINLTSEAAGRFTDHPDRAILVAVIVTALTLSIAGSYILSRYYERPLSRLLLRHKQIRNHINKP